MRQTTKKTDKKEKSVKKTKKTKVEKPKKKVEKSLTPEPATEKLYVNIKEFEPELMTKTRKLKIIVGVFSVLLIAVWLVILRHNINAQSGSVNFSLLKDEINESLMKFDNEIVNRKTNEEIVINDIDQLKNKLENETVKTSSALWPTRQFTNLGLSLQYPEDWQSEEEDKQLTLKEANQEASLSIELVDNKNNLEIETWLEETNFNLSDYEPVTEIFKFSTATPQTLTYIKKTTTGTEELLYLIKQEGIILTLKALLNSENSDYKLLIEEIIKTIKTN